MTLSDEVVKLLRDRRAEQVWFALVEPDSEATFDKVAQAVGLEPLGRLGWVEMSREQAHLFLTALLHRSLAYTVELMPGHRAAWLAEQFINATGQYGGRFATNCGGTPGEFPLSYNPATEFTFDAGVVALGTDASAVYWVAEED